MYVKLFSTLIHSTVWREEMHVKVVWITMLAMADEQGYVWASIPGLADAARVNLGQCEEALARLSSPDPYSRTQDHEGRRIVAVDGGWQLLNFAKYRQLRDAEHRREQVREAVRRHRTRRKAGNQNGNQVKSNVSSGKPRKAHTESEAESEEKRVKATDTADTLFETFWRAYPKRAGGNPKKAARYAWDARLKQGIDPEALIQGAVGYAAFCEADGKVRTQFVKQAQFWLSASYEGWAQDWTNHPNGDSADPLAGASVG